MFYKTKNKEKSVAQLKAIKNNYAKKQNKEVLTNEFKTEYAKAEKKLQQKFVGKNFNYSNFDDNSYEKDYIDDKVQSVLDWDGNMFNTIDKGECSKEKIKESISFLKFEEYLNSNSKKPL